MFGIGSVPFVNMFERGEAIILCGWCKNFFAGEAVMADISVRLLAGDDEEKSFSLSQQFASDVARLSGVNSYPAPSAPPSSAKRVIWAIWGK